jgi:hypothetical protein
MRRSAFRGRYTADHIRAVFNHLLGVKRPFFARDALHDEARVFVN